MSRSGVPISPPETNTDAIGPSTIPYSAFHPGNHELQSNETEPSPAHSTPTSEPPGGRFRRISSITYLTSGSKDSHERAPQRWPKPFVIIIPPASLIQQHGQLGHTLASGPHHRLSDGLLIPLFPTMYGQLTAIAREFNFPSTTGLCLYFHFVENGVTMIPRISDETWPFLWAHVFEASSASKSPISGKIEFDFDLHQARWYAAWLASSHRENIDPSFSVFKPSAASVTHEQGDSKSTVQEEDQEMIRSVFPTTRHVPRKLSLVNRLEIHSARSGSLLASRTELSPPEHTHPSSSRILSPIFQDEEPKTTRQDLDGRINSWRSNAILKPTSLVATGKTSLERANMPSSLPINDTLLDMPNEQINLEDFTWSVTSAGPGNCELLSPVSSNRVPSVHIANRMEGSVCLTPSDRTSFGPSDYNLTSPIPSNYRLPSPDIAYRMFENAPQTPSTATTWGAPTDFPHSPALFSRPPSVDLGERMIFSRPVTPTTATSWGPASWPSSPHNTEYTSKSIHLGDRGDFSRPVTPSTATSWGAPLSWPPSPATPFYVTTPDVGHGGSEDTEYEVGRSHVSWSPTIGADGSRYIRASSDVPWGHSWPYRKFGRVCPTPQISLDVPSIYPRLVIYRSVYPHFDLYPEVTLAKGSLPGYPDFGLYPDVSPYATRDNLAVQRAISVELTPCYPVFDLYPAIYPENLYRIHPLTDLSTGSVDSVSTYLYPASRSVPSQRTPVTQNLDIGTQQVQKYTDFDLYPAVNGITISGNPKVPGHLHFDLCPSVQSVNALRNSEAMEHIPVQPKKRSFPTVYPAIYPHFNICKSSSQLYGTTTKPLADPPLTLPTPAAASRPAECSVRVMSTYPVFDLYPAVYPAFEIYPRAERTNSPANKEVVSRVLGYPHIEIYPFISAEEILSRKSRSVRAPSSYPTFNLYPSVYPFFELYPVFPYDISRAPKFTGYSDFDLEHAHSLKMLPHNSDHTGYVYPIFNLYPAVYPYFDLYPVIAGMVENKKAAQPTTGTITVKVQPSYPAFDLYSAIYPYFELWPSIDLPRIESIPRPRAKPLDKLTDRGVQATVTMRARFGSRTNSHADPVFPDGISRENDSPIDVTLKNISSSEALSRRVSSLRPNDAKPPLPASTTPIRHLSPSRSENYDDRLSTTVIGFESAKDETSESPLQTSLQRASPLQFPQDFGPRLSPGSLMNGSSRRAIMSENTGRPNSVVLPSVSPRRRDSLVSHRARVYNGSQDGIKIPMDTPSKFSPPPVPSIPHAPPKPLDNLKHPYAP